jgi:signal transduction histidine kinase
MTKTAKKILAALMFGNAVIIIVILLLSQYFYYVNIKPVVPPHTVHSLARFVHFLKEKPEIDWAKMVHRQTIPWTIMSLSETPVYQANVLLGLQSPILLELLKQNKKLQTSVLLKNGVWLNISMTPPLPNQTGIRLTMLSLLVLLLMTMLLINYWAVKTLNQPIQTLIQSLNYNDAQDNWLPMPLTGNSDQTIVFEKINALQEKVNRLLLNRTRVVTAISHDLRTPLTRLKLRAEYLVDDPNFEKFMRDINEMEMMIRETLDYFSDLNREEKMQRFDLVAMLSSIREDAVEQKLDVVFEGDTDKLIYLGCVNLLKRAFSNLINNAVYYGHRASIQLHRTPRKIEITISDNGPGLKGEEMEQVFMPYYRGESSRSRSTGGTGIGLTIAREIIQKHGGTITLANRLQGGLDVNITLPIHP